MNFKSDSLSYAKANRKIGKGYRELHNYEKVLYYYSLSIPALRLMRIDSSILFEAHKKLADSTYIIRDYKKTAEHYLACLSFFDFKYQYDDKSEILYGIAFCYALLGEKNKSINFTFKTNKSSSLVNRFIWQLLSKLCDLSV